MASSAFPLPSHQALDEELRLNKCSSFELIEQYFLEKISQQVGRTPAGPPQLLAPALQREEVLIRS